MFKVENRFMVMALMEDMLFPVIAPGDDDGSAVLALANTQDIEGAADRDTSVELPPHWDENEDRRGARVRALKHLPSLICTMPAQWCKFEVAPYLQRCAHEEDVPLSLAVMEVMEKLLLDTLGLKVQAVNVPLGGDTKTAPKAKAGVAFEVVDFIPTFEVLFGSRRIDVIGDRALILFRNILTRFHTVSRATTPEGQQERQRLEEQFCTQAIDLARGLLEPTQPPLVQAHGVKLLAELFCALNGSRREFTSFLPEYIIENLASGKQDDANSASPPRRHHHSPQGSAILCRAIVESAPLAWRLYSFAGARHGEFDDPAVDLATAGIKWWMGYVQSNVLEPEVPHWTLVDAVLGSLPKLLASLSRIRGEALEQEEDDRVKAQEESSGGGGDGGGPGMSRQTSLYGTEDLVRIVHDQLVRPLVRQPGWKVRWSLAKHAAALGVHVARPLGKLPEFIKTTLRTLADDYEPEVRAQAIEALGSLVDQLMSKPIPLTAKSFYPNGGQSSIDPQSTATLYSKMMPVVMDFVDFAAGDRCTASKEHLAKTIAIVCNMVRLVRRGSIEDPSEKLLLKATFSLLREDSGTTVQLKLISHMKAVIDCFGQKTVEGELLSLMDRLGADSLWRVRQRVFQVLPPLCWQFYQFETLSPQELPGQRASPSRMDSDGFLRRQLLPRFTAGVFDGAKTVQHCAIGALKKFVAQVSDPNHSSSATEVNSGSRHHRLIVDQILWPLLFGHEKAQGSFQFRCILIQAAFGMDVHHDNILFPLLAQYVEDPVVNVRLAVAKHLGYSLVFKSRNQSTPTGSSPSEQTSSAESTLSAFKGATDMSENVTTQFSDEEKGTTVLALVRALVGDKDQDVRSFAAVALANCH